MSMLLMNGLKSWPEECLIRNTRSATLCYEAAALAESGVGAHPCGGPTQRGLEKSQRRMKLDIVCGLAKESARCIKRARFHKRSNRSLRRTSSPENPALASPCGAQVEKGGDGMVPLPDVIMPRNRSPQ